MEEHALKLAPEKSEAIMLVGKRNAPETPKFFLQGQVVSVKKEVWYLGVTLTERLTGTPHVMAAVTKATKAANNIAKILPRRFGVTEAKRKLLAAVAESITLYA